MLSCPPVSYDRKEITMHCLHKILVYIPDAIDVVEGTPRAEILSAVTCYARNQTERFYEKAYDWREDDSAGGWKEEYPQQAYLASEDPEWFLKELEDVQHTQKAEITFALEHLKDTVGTDLLQIVSKLWNRDIRSDAPSHDITAMPAYHLRVLAELLDGEYRCDSCFYNTSENTARLFQCDLDEIRQNPSEWALVMFDYHY